MILDGALTILACDTLGKVALGISEILLLETPNE
jgi:hypothetical protein